MSQSFPTTSHFDSENNMLFWTIIGGLATFVSLIFVTAIRRTPSRPETVTTFSLRIYRDQLDEVDRDLARGVLDEDTAERMRLEISRRILTTDAQCRDVARHFRNTQSGTLFFPAFIGTIIIFGSLLLYQQLGAPGYGDLSLAKRIELAQAARLNRPSQDVAENSRILQPDTDATPEFLALMQKLRERTAERPHDLQGQILLARNEAALGNFEAGYRAQERILSIKGNESTAEDWTNYAELLILAAGGYVSPLAEDALRTSLEHDPQLGSTRYYWGLMHSQIGRPDLAFLIWNSLLSEGPDTAPWIPPIREQIEHVAARAGQHNFVLPQIPNPIGPTRHDIEAAQDMTEEERQDMIEAMVFGLEGRLEAEGGSADEWLRLMRSLVVLERMEDARNVYNKASTSFTDNDTIDVLERAARQLGLIP